MAAAIVQSSSSVAGGYPSASASFSSLPTVGNVVFVTGVWNPSFGTEPTGITVSDNQGNTYSTTTHRVVTQENGVFIARAVVATSSGTFTVTATVTGGSADAGVGLRLIEVSGMDNSDLLDQTGTGQQFLSGGSDFTVTASGANTGADRLVIAVVSGRGDDITPTNSPPSSGYTNSLALSSGGFGEPRGLSAYKIVTSSETSSANWGTISGGSGSGSLVIATFKVATGGATSHAATGALTGPGSTVAGSAQHNTPHPSSGALTGPGSTVVGSAARTRAHPSSGALTGPGSTVAGTAARTRQHAATGALTGPGSEIAGSAARTRQHAGSGDLVGPGSEIVGSADHQAAAGVHDSTGALVGQGSTVAGSAARFRAFAATGVLTGQGSEISGSAARVAGPVSHAATGVLVGPGSEIVGSANHTGPAVSHDATGALVGSGAVVVGVAQNGVVPDTPFGGGFFTQAFRRRLFEEEMRERLKELPEQVAEVIENKVIESIDRPKKPTQKELRQAFERENIPYREAYRKAVISLVQDMRQMEEDEEEEEAIAFALLG